MCFTGAEIAIASAVMTAASSVVSGVAAKQQGDYNAKVAEQNALTARQQGQAEADLIEDKHQRIRATQRVQALGSGVDPGYGSAALVIDQEGGRNSWLDQMTTVWNRNTEAIGYENKAKAFKAEGKAKMIGEFAKAGGSLMGGFKPKIV